MKALILFLFPILAGDVGAAATLSLDQADPYPNPEAGLALENQNFFESANPIFCANQAIFGIRAILEPDQHFGYPSKP